MTDTFEKLKAQLTAQGELSDEAISAAEAAGAMTEEERVWLDAERHRLRTENRAGEEITLEQYVAATQVLDTAAPGSPEYLEAERIVEAFESAA